MTRILTGIQSTGTPHLGNIIGAIAPAIAMSQNPDNECFYFIADMHALTQIKQADVLRQNSLSVAAAWLALGLDTSRHTFYRQSDVPEVTELAWYLNCFAPFPMLANAHSFKDKSDRLSDVNAGLFTYPVLQAADIILYDAHQVPVGKDQLQHLEITRDLANAVNHRIGEVFVVPEAKLGSSTLVPGTDGQKMSKSYNNYINIFEDDKALRKAVMRIVTNTLPVEAPKDPDTCNVFGIYKTVATANQIASMRARYLAGGLGYGQAKQELYEVLLERFGEARKQYARYMQNTELLETELQRGAQKAREVAQVTLKRVRKAFGFGPA